MLGIAMSAGQDLIPGQKLTVAEYEAMIDRGCFEGENKNFELSLRRVTEDESCRAGA